MKDTEIDKLVTSVEANICYHLDMDVYIPVVKELEGCGRTYSLGQKKEIFKGLIEQEMLRLRRALKADQANLKKDIVKAISE